MEIIKTFEHEVENGKCTSRQLQENSKVSNKTAQKAIDFYYTGEIIQPKRGHGYQGTGSLVNIKIHHHAFIYNLYLKNHHFQPHPILLNSSKNSKLSFRRLFFKDGLKLLDHLKEK